MTATWGEFPDYRPTSEIDRMTGVLTFTDNTPDYENPMSAAAADTTVTDLAD